MTSLLTKRRKLRKYKKYTFNKRIDYEKELTTYLTKIMLEVKRKKTLNCNGVDRLLVLTTRFNLINRINSIIFYIANNIKVDQYQCRKIKKRINREYIKFLRLQEKCKC